MISSIRDVMLVLGVAVLLGACRPGGGAPGAGGVPASPSPQPSPTPSSAEGGTRPDADLVGTFGGDPQLEGGCAWIDTDDGERYEVIYPEGWTVVIDPPGLVDPAGRVRAETGDRVAVNGEVVEDAVSICQVGPIFQATEVHTDD